MIKRLGATISENLTADVAINYNFLHTLLEKTLGKGAIKKLKEGVDSGEDIDIHNYSPVVKNAWNIKEN
eukprot:snap_masked-scaffold_6-processed-gene-7.27-mRNA-1 protein AED:1.00 eAED:1.00 QI:0/-1/0/0/-1/1/1/0/68